MNEVLRHKVNMKKLVELKAIFKDVTLDQEDSHYCTIRKYCFMKYDLERIRAIGVEILGVFEDKSFVKLHIKL